MRKRRGNAQFMTLLAIPLIIVVCLFWMSVKESNEADTSAGLEYIQGMESQDVQKVEQNLANSKVESTEAPTEPPTEEPTQVPTEASTEELTEAPTEESTEESTEPPTEAPTEPPTEAPTEAPTQPQTPPVVQGQSYVPYEVDQELLAATLAQLNSVDIKSADYLAMVKAIYQDSLFFGDSITSGFSLYKVLNDNNVIAEVGGTVYGHLPNNSGTVVGYNPKVLLLHYGLNEMDPSEAGMKSIIAQYKQCIQSLKTQLPNTKIIVLGLAPVTDAAIAKQSRFTWIGTYNDHMRTMCQELGIGFYQNDQFFYDRMHLYGSDGIHIKKELYLHWIKDITKEMGLY